jgi:quercetin dioxygenase-like cupin family protein
MALPFLEYDLVREVRQLHEEPSWTNGQNAKTLAKYDDFRIVLMAVQAGALVPLHKAPGCISIHMISGHVLVHALERTFNLLPGSLLAFDKEVPHHLQAIEESALLLSIVWPGRQETRARKI